MDSLIGAIGFMVAVGIVAALWDHPATPSHHSIGYVSQVNHD